MANSRESNSLLYITGSVDHKVLRNAAILFQRVLKIREVTICVVSYYLMYDKQKTSKVIKWITVYIPDHNHRISKMYPESRILVHAATSERLEIVSMLYSPY